MRSAPPPLIALRAAILFLAIAAPVTVLAGLVYVSVQQNFRQNANDPQVALAGDALAALEGGRQPSDVVPKEKVDFGKSLSPFLMVLNDAGEPLASSGELDGRVPRIPVGVLDYVRRHGEERVTWQPRPDARCALVVRHARAGQASFVAAGRSLQEVEVREGQLTQLVGLGWAAALLAVGFVCVVGAFIESAVTRHSQ